jgi:uncharacterized protein (TIGR02996 family)
MDDESFVQGILAAPEDAALRLVYADWLEERGDPRGEYLRCQCALAALRPEDRKHTALRRREKELRRQYPEVILPWERRLMLGQTWVRIHSWLKMHCPVVLASLGPPATDEQFRAAEQAMGVELPEEVKDCYRIHDGQRVIPTPVGYASHLRCIPAFLYGEDWPGLADMVERWRGMKELLDGGTFAKIKGQPRGPIRSDWWHPKWLPLTEDHSGHMRCLDLAPKGRGRVGQVIYWCHDDPSRGVLANSLPEWLTQFALSVERGEYTTAPDKHGPGLIRVRDL